MRRSACWLSAVTLVLGLTRVAGAGKSETPDVGSFSGIVIETMDASRYTYVCVDTGKEKIWAAAPACKVKKGDQVTILGGMRMENFESKGLKRKFEALYFVDRITVSGAAGATRLSSTATNLPPGHPPITPPAGCMATNLPSGHPPMGKRDAPEVKSMRFDDVRKADGGKTVAEVYAEKATLAGKPVAVRGKVVKVTPAVMNRTWIHLQDGSGTGADSDLTVTSDATAQVGDTVTARGVLAVDRDFGLGYRFAVIVENASVNK